MRHAYKILALSALLFALSAPAAHAQISFGIHIGEPPAPRAYRVPPRPGPDYVWVEGYHRWDGRAYAWVPGRWDRGPQARAVWVPGRWVQDKHGWYYVQGHWR